MQRDVQLTVIGKVFKPNPNKVLALNMTLKEYFRLVRWYLSFNSTSKTLLHENGYEEAKRLWREIYDLREEQGKLGFDRREYGVYLTLKGYGFSEKRAIEVTRRLINAIKNMIDVPGWSSNPALVNEVKRRVAFTILRESRRMGMPIGEAKKLIDTILERVQSVE